jgi:hypothetical protein
MARSSYSSHRGPRGQGAWAVAQKPRPMPRLVRLGRAANDNGRRTSLRARLLVVALATALAMVALYDWRLL